MDINTLQYMKERAERGENMQAAIRELNSDIKILESYPGLKFM